MVRDHADAGNGGDHAHVAQVVVSMLWHRDSDVARMRTSRSSCRTAKAAIRARGGHVRGWPGRGLSGLRGHRGACACHAPPGRLAPGNCGKEGRTVGWKIGGRSGCRCVRACVCAPACLRACVWRVRRIMMARARKKQQGIPVPAAPPSSRDRPPEHGRAGLPPACIAPGMSRRAARRGAGEASSSERHRIAFGAARRGARMLL